MREELIKQIVFRVLRSITPEIDFDTIRLDENMQEALDIDSYDLLTLFIQIDEELGVEIPEEEYGALRTLNDLIGYIAARSG